SGARARRTMRTRPSRNTAADTARIGRDGNSRSFMGRLPQAFGSPIRTVGHPRHPGASDMDREASPPRRAGKADGATISLQKTGSHAIVSNWNRLRGTVRIGEKGSGMARRFAHNL